MYKRIIIIFFSIFLSITLLLIHSKNQEVYSGSVRNFTVVVDAGHGGIDQGAIGGVLGVSEAEINLIIAKKLYQKFSDNKINCHLTRTSSLGLYGVPTKGFKLRDLKKRVEITKNSSADLFISIHMNNFFDTRQCGAKVFYKNDEKSKNFATFVQAELDIIDTDNKDFVPQYGDYYVLNYQSVPSILCECGFLSNPQDEKKLTEDSYQNEIVDAIFNGTLKFCILEKF